MLTVGAEPSTRRKQKHKRVRRQRTPKRLNVERIVGVWHKVTPRYCSMRLLLPVLGLIIFGIFMIYSASNYNAKIYYDDPFYYTVKQLIGLVLGLIGLALMYFIKYSWMQR